MKKGKINSYKSKKAFWKIILNKAYFRKLKQELQKYYQHGNTTTYKHSRNVAYEAFLFALKHNIKINYERLVCGSFCHDFFMYDWHEKSTEHRLHGYTHAHTAAINAKKHFDLDEHELSMIESHMWPLNLTKLPKSKEAWILCLADKKVALAETFSRR